MFTSKNIPALFKRAALKLDEERARLCQATFIVEPFTHALAHQLWEDVASHLFDGQEFVRPEFKGIEFVPPAGTRLQHMSVRITPDMPGRMRIEDVSIEGYSVTKVSDETPVLKLTIQTLFNVTPKAHREFVIDQFGNELFLTFERVQGSLIDKDDTLAGAKDAAARLAEMGGGTLVGPDGETVLGLRKVDASRLRQEAADLRKRRDRKAPKRIGRKGKKR